METKEKKKCESDGHILTSLPAKYRCKNCYQTWICGLKTPECKEKSCENCDVYISHGGTTHCFCSKKYCGSCIKTEAEFEKAKNDGSLAKILETKELNWEEEFDNKFGGMVMDTPGDGDGGCGETVFLRNEPEFVQLKDFISKVRTHAIEQERERIVGVIEEWTPKKDHTGYGVQRIAMTLDDHQRNFSRDIISLITQK